MEADKEEAMELKNIKSITPLKSVSPVKDIKEVVAIYRLTPEQASRLEELNSISETRNRGSQNMNRIVAPRPMRLG